MTKNEIFEAFERLFPERAKDVKGIKKLGSKSIGLRFEDAKLGETSLVFLYYDDTNWNFGTKPWRKRPEPGRKKEKNTRKIEANEKVCANCCNFGNCKKEDDPTSSTDPTDSCGDFKFAKENK